MNTEAALITKVLETKRIDKAIDSKVSECIQFYKDIWLFIEDYYFRYRSVPGIDVVKQKYPDFEPQDVDASLEYLVDQVSSEYIRSQLEDLMARSARMLEEEPKAALEYLFAKASSLSHRTDVVKDVDLAKDYWMRIESLRRRADISDGGKQILGIPSGIPQVDLLFGGWQPGDFIVIMGWTASAKTWLATKMAVTAWEMGYEPLFFSLEMDDVQFAYRVDTILGKGAFSNTSLINARNIDIDAYEEWLKRTFDGKHPFYVVTNEGLDEVNQLTIQSKIEQYRPSCVLVDYHALLSDVKKGKSETERHKNLSKDLKRMAVRYGIPIIDIVGVTMEDGHEQRPPELNEVAWSKQLAYDADLVLSLFRTGQVVTVEAKKSRRSELFAFQVTWDFDSGTFTVNDW